ncbi:hypothetical protein JXB41_06145 [Candidatus Woesearchaeota archaeon]|nr:hypothetical protein [Candidatus Woesearchaeota archaeon]
MKPHGYHAHESPGRAILSNKFLKANYFQVKNEKKLPSLEEKAPDALEMAAQKNEKRKEKKNSK